MAEEARLKKEIQERKREFQDKKVDLISRLCAGETPSDKEKDPADKQK